MMNIEAEICEMLRKIIRINPRLRFGKEKHKQKFKKIALAEGSMLMIFLREVTCAISSFDACRLAPKLL